MRFLGVVVALLVLLLMVSAQDDTLLIDDFETGVPQQDADGVAVGYIAWGDQTGNTVLGVSQAQPFTDLALPDATTNNQVFRIDYEIGGWGGFTHAFTDGDEWTSMDWTAHNALQFWLYGNNTGQPIQVDIFDNRNLDIVGDSAERYFYRLLDDYTGWQQYTIPLAFFQRRTDFQPNGAPDDGFNLDAVSGYAFGFPAGVGAQSAYIDDVQLVVVDDAATVQIRVLEPDVTAIEIDESITWDSREWNLVWADEFDAAAGMSLDEAQWTCRVGGGRGWGNSELQYYTDRSDNVTHDGAGHLLITAHDEALDGAFCWYGECQYTSARCNTQDKFEFMHGRVDVRAQIPAGQGIWPAFWMLGSEFPVVNWPDSGEIDIMENIGREPNTIHGTVHGPGYAGGNGISGSLTTDVVYSEDFHVYTIDWDPNVIRWYVDGEHYHTVSVNDMNGRDWVFEQDFYLIMNVAVGGTWPGDPDETTQFPQTMTVDYVRVYDLASE